MIVPFQNVLRFEIQQNKPDNSTVVQAPGEWTGICAMRLRPPPQLRFFKLAVWYTHTHLFVMLSTVHNAVCFSPLQIKNT
jgi:hypothetical protein